jgi:hypothetical protein
VEEIKNAEKQLKIVEKECMYLEKKEQRMKKQERAIALLQQQSVSSPRPRSQRDDA